MTSPKSITTTNEVHIRSSNGITFYQLLVSTSCSFEVGMEINCTVISLSSNDWPYFGDTLTEMSPPEPFRSFVTVAMIGISIGNRRFEAIRFRFSVSKFECHTKFCDLIWTDQCNHVLEYLKKIRMISNRNNDTSIPIGSIMSLIVLVGNNSNVCQKIQFENYLQIAFMKFILWTRRPNLDNV